MSYVGVVVALATAGFVTESPAPILLAALIALPASLVAVPGYYRVRPARTRPGREPVDQLRIRVILQ